MEKSDAVLAPKRSNPDSKRVNLCDNRHVREVKCLVRISSPIAAARRASWLAELSETLGQAEKLLLQLASEDSRRADASQLLARIEAVRTEIEMLRLDGRPRGNPKAPRQWIGSPLWQPADQCSG